MHRNETRLIVIAADVVGRFVVLRHDGGLVEEVELGREEVGAAQAEERQEVLRLGPLSRARCRCMRIVRRSRPRGRGGGARVRLVLQLEGGLRLRPAPPAARGHHRPRHLRRLGRATRRGALALGELALGVHAGPRTTKIEHF